METKTPSKTLTLNTSHIQVPHAEDISCCRGLFTCNVFWARFHHYHRYCLALCQWWRCEWITHFYRPQRSWGKVIFLHVSVILFTVGGGGYPSMHCRWYPSMPCRSRGGVLSQHALQVSRPTPMREVEGSGQGGLQAHTQGGSWGDWPGGSPGPHPGKGVSRPTPGGSPGPHLGGSPGPHPGGCIHACTEADLPDGYCWGGTHPTGMHSCLSVILMTIKRTHLITVKIMDTNWKRYV